MAKKTDSTKKPAVSAAPAARVTPAVKAAPKPKLAGKTRAASAGKKAKPTARVATPAYTREDIALRAYFISEKRRANGVHGDEHQDWLEAERQLAAESARPARSKKASPARAGSNGA